jgi:O-antigen ligase
MNVISKIKAFLDSREFLGYLIALILSTLLIGFAPSSIAVGVFVFFALRYSIIHKEKQTIDLKLVLPIALYLLFSLTLFWTVDDDQTKKGVDRTVVLLLIPIAFNFVPKFTLKSFNLILRLFTGANVLFGLFFLVSASIRYFRTSSLSAFTYHELVSDLNLNAIYVSVMFAISLFYVLSTKGKKIKDILKIIFFSILIILLSSKTILTVLILGCLVYLFYFKVSKVKLVAIIIIGALIFGFASKKTLERILFEKETKVKEVWTENQFGQVYLWTGTSIRLLQLRILKEQIEEEQIFWKGFGLFASKDNIKKRHQEFNTYPGFHSYNYHNQYAQIFSETGIFGLALLLSMLGVLFVGAIKSKNFLFLMFSITVAIVFFTESLLWRQSGLFLFIILYCLFNRISLENKKS